MPCSIRVVINKLIAILLESIKKIHSIRRRSRRLSGPPPIDNRHNSRSQSRLIFDGETDRTRHHGSRPRTEHGIIWDEVRTAARDVWTLITVWF